MLEFMKAEAGDRSMVFWSLIGLGLALSLCA